MIIWLSFILAIYSITIIQSSIISFAYSQTQIINLVNKIPTDQNQYTLQKSVQSIIVYNQSSVSSSSLSSKQESTKLLP